MKKLVLLAIIAAALVLTGCKQPGSPEKTEENVNPLLGTWERTFTWTHGPNDGITSTETFTFNADLTGVTVQKYTPRPPVDDEDSTIPFTYRYDRKPITHHVNWPSPNTIIETDGMIIFSFVKDGVNHNATGYYKCISDTKLEFTDYWYEMKPGLLTYTKK